MRLAPVGNDVYLGSFDACDLHGGAFDRVVHLYRNGDLGSGKACRVCQDRDDTRGLRVFWREGEHVDRLSVPFDTLWDYVRQPGRLLVHCRAGECRSANVALIAKVARGCDPFDGIRDLFKATWDHKRYSPVLFPEQFRSVLGKIDGKHDN